MGFYDEIMQYKVNNYSMENDNKERFCPKTKEIYRKKNIKLNHSKVFKDFEFEELVKKFFEINFRLNFRSMNSENSADEEKKFTVHEININLIQKLNLNDKCTLKVNNKNISCLYFESINEKHKINYHLQVKIDEGQNLTYNVNRDIEMKTQDGISFCAFYESDKYILSFSVLAVDDYLTSEKNSLIFYDENNLQLLKIFVNSNKQCEIDYLNKDNLGLIETNSPNEYYVNIANKRNNRRGQEKYYHINIQKKLRKIDGIFEIVNYKLFDFLVEKMKIFEQIGTETEKAKHPFKIRLNFNLFEKKNKIKKVYIESKSSSNNLSKIIKQFIHHTKHLISNPSEVDEALFLLFIQNYPNPLSLSQLQRLFDLERLVAVIIIEPKEFNRLPYINSGDYSRKQMESRNVVIHALEDFKEIFGSKTITNEEYHQFVFSSGKKSLKGLNDFKDVKCDEFRIDNSQINLLFAALTQDKISNTKEVNIRGNNQLTKSIFINKDEKKKIDFVSTRGQLESENLKLPFENKDKDQQIADKIDCLREELTLMRKDLEEKTKKEICDIKNWIGKLLFLSFALIIGVIGLIAFRSL